MYTFPISDIQKLAQQLNLKIPRYTIISLARRLEEDGKAIKEYGQWYLEQKSVFDWLYGKVPLTVIQAVLREAIQSKLLSREQSSQLENKFREAMLEYQEGHNERRNWYNRKIVQFPVERIR